MNESKKSPKGKRRVNRRAFGGGRFGNSGYGVKYDCRTFDNYSRKKFTFFDKLWDYTLSGIECFWNNLSDKLCGPSTHDYYLYDSQWSGRKMHRELEREKTLDQITHAFANVSYFFRYWNEREWCYKTASSKFRGFWSCLHKWLSLESYTVNIDDKCLPEIEAELPRHLEDLGYHKAEIDMKNPEVAKWAQKLDDGLIYYKQHGGLFLRPSCCLIGTIKKRYGSEMVAVVCCSRHYKNKLTK